VTPRGADGQLAFADRPVHHVPGEVVMGTDRHALDIGRLAPAMVIATAAPSSRIWGLLQQ